MTVREQIEKKEAMLLSPYATLSSASRGREKEEKRIICAPYS